MMLQVDLCRLDVSSPLLWLRKEGNIKKSPQATVIESTLENFGETRDDPRESFRRYPLDR
jgi:hypothetical protein